MFWPIPKLCLAFAFCGNTFCSRGSLRCLLLSLVCLAERMPASICPGADHMFPKSDVPSSKGRSQSKQTRGTFDKGRFQGQLFASHWGQANHARLAQFTLSELFGFGTRIVITFMARSTRFVEFCRAWSVGFAKDSSPRDERPTGKASSKAMPEV